jgi:hypothetical protein
MIRVNYCARIKTEGLKQVLPFLSGITFFSVVCTCFSFSFGKSATADLSGSSFGRRASASAVMERDCRKLQREDMVSKGGSNRRVTF